jgi:hypothetical protein
MEDAVPKTLMDLLVMAKPEIGESDKQAYIEALENDKLKQQTSSAVGAM